MFSAFSNVCCVNLSSWFPTTENCCGDVRNAGHAFLCLIVATIMRCSVPNWNCWLVVWYMTFIYFYDFPYIGNNDPSWLIFFRGVETTNQIAKSILASSNQCNSNMVWYAYIWMNCNDISAMMGIGYRESAPSFSHVHVDESCIYRWFSQL